MITKQQKAKLKTGQEEKKNAIDLDHLGEKIAKLLKGLKIAAAEIALKNALSIIKWNTEIK